MAYVYFIGEKGTSGPLKIGVSRISIRKRMANLQTAAPFELVCHDYIEVPDEEGPALEAAIHKLLAKKRLRGEWFAIDPEDIIPTAEKIGFMLGYGKMIAYEHGRLP